MKTTTVGLFALFAVMMLPAGLANTQDDEGAKFYGAATILVRDNLGNEIFQQTVHNQLVDTGEAFIIDQTFKEGGANENAEAVQIASICVSDAVTITVAETETASDFDTDNTITQTNCIEDTAVDDSTPSTAVIGPLTFTSGTHTAAGDTVTGIAICQGNSGTTPFNNCGTADGAAGILFAVVDTSDVTISGVETVDVTYTFDITSTTT